ncbi:hypothetical protein [Bradyrhizobium prioriisuperbiae]|uniref:hypothetical protein n=1 Tax=Bradyrhizobium prioriisuperbiae TaxID=2854389 RepID=UPI0028E89E4F|nr:hypothetical protein [Bradyrhizobium prioritasuperba]
MMTSRRLTIALAVTLCATPGIAQATCQFTAIGNPLTGTRYTAATSIPNLTPAGAVNQMRIIAPQEKLDVVSANPAAGQMELELPESFTHKAILFDFTAVAEPNGTRALLLVKLRVGALSGEESFKKDMCAMLAKLQGAKAGAGAKKKQP